MESYSSRSEYLFQIKHRLIGTLAVVLLTQLVTVQKFQYEINVSFFKKGYEYGLIHSP